MRTPYPRTRTESYPAVGERRWVDGDFLVEVLAYEYRYVGTGEKQMAFVLLDPEHCTYDPADPGRNVNYQDPERLLTAYESARHNVQLAAFHAEEAERHRKSAASSDAKLRRAKARSLAQYEAHTGRPLEPGDLDVLAP